MKKKKILFVCLGNICRSAVAEAIAQKYIEERGWGDRYEVDSAGIAAYHEGERADARMIQHGARRGYRVDSISRPVRISDFEESDLLLAMDDSNYSALLDRALTPEYASKVERMASYVRRLTHFDYIPDPYYGGRDGFELVIDLLEDAIEGLFEALEERRNEG